MKTYTYPNGSVIREDFSEFLDQYRLKPKEALGVLKKHGLIIQANAAKDAPVDTGALRNSIISEDVDEKTVQISDGVEYGVFQELGTSRGVSAKHFLGGATERQANPLFSDLKEVLKP